MVAFLPLRTQSVTKGGGLYLIQVSILTHLMNEGGYKTGRNLRALFTDY
jgi:hypothetical protein